MACKALELLTTREREIAAAYASGAGSREIAGQLCIAQSTVKTHLQAIYGKLGVSNKVGFLNAFRPPPALPDPDRDGHPARIAVLRPVDPTSGVAESQLTGVVAQAVTSALYCYPDVRIVIAAPGQPRAAGLDCAEIARALRADYLALPSFAVCAGGAELLLQLVDGAGSVRWILRRELPLPCPRDLIAEAAEAFAVQVAGMRGEIVRLERQRRLCVEATPADAYELYLAAGALHESGVREEAETAIALAERAVALDPRFSRGWLMLNWCRHAHAAYGWAPSDPPEQETAVFRRAAELAPRDGLPLAYLGLARAKAGAQGEAERLIERGCDLALRCPDTAVDLSIGLIGVRGEAERALRMIEDALARCPEPPPTWRYMEARAAFFANLPERALRTSDLGPDCVPNLVMRTLAAAELGDEAETRRSWARLNSLTPRFDLRAYAQRMPITHPRSLARYVAAARKVHIVVTTEASSPSAR